MADDQVVVQGAEAATADISAWVAQLPAEVGKELEPFGRQLVATLYGKQPFDSGTLAGSAELLPGEVDSFFGLALGREVEYAGWIEFGGKLGREYVPEGRTVYPTAVEAEGQFDRLAEQATSTSIERYPWHQEQA